MENFWEIQSSANFPKPLDSDGDHIFVNMKDPVLIIDLNWSVQQNDIIFPNNMIVKVKCYMTMAGGTERVTLWSQLAYARVKSSFRSRTNLSQVRWSVICNRALLLQITFI